MCEIDGLKCLSLIVKPVKLWKDKLLCILIVHFDIIRDTEAISSSTQKNIRAKRELSMHRKSCDIAFDESMSAEIHREQIPV